MLRGSGQELGSDEVFLVLHAQAAYYVYIVDLSDTSDSLVQRNPVLQTVDDFSICMAFVVVNSTLYLFGGMGGMGDPEWLTQSYSYPLSPHQTDTCKQIYLSDLARVTPMITPKKFPRAVSIGDKICVFSTYLDRFGFNFELYNPSADEWYFVPEPRIDFMDLAESAVVFRRAEYCEIKMYCVKNLCLFISTAKGSYCLDFGQPGNDYEREWVPCDFPLASATNHYRFAQHFLKDGNLLCTPSFEVYDLNKQERQWRLPSSSFPSMRNQYFKRYDVDIFLLPKKTKEERLRASVFEAGFLRSSFDWDSEEAFWVSLVKFDDDDHADDTKKLTPTILNSKLLKLGCNISTGN